MTSRSISGLARDRPLRTPKIALQVRADTMMPMKARRWVGKQFQYMLAHVVGDDIGRSGQEWQQQNRQPDAPRERNIVFAVVGSGGQSGKQDTGEHQCAAG